KRELRVPSDPVAWPDTFAWLAWRLHVPAAVPDLAARPPAAEPPPRERGAHAWGEAAARRPPARDRCTGVQRRARRVRRDAEDRRQQRSASRARDMVAAHRALEQLGRSQPARGAEGDRHLRSRRRQARGSRHAEAAREYAGALD